MMSACFPTGLSPGISRAGRPHSDRRDSICDEARNSRSRSRITGDVTTILAREYPPRALRLKTEAGNCLALAVGQPDPAFAAELIDEALRLMRRAQELARAAAGKD